MLKAAQEGKGRLDQPEELKTAVGERADKRRRPVSLSI